MDCSSAYRNALACARMAGHFGAIGDAKHESDYINRAVSLLTALPNIEVRMVYLQKAYHSGHAKISLQRTVIGRHTQKSACLE
jgi:hypothetical protein